MDWRNQKSTVLIKVTVPFKITTIDVSHLKLSPQPAPALKLVKKLAHLCRKYGFEAEIVEEV